MKKTLEEIFGTQPTDTSQQSSERKSLEEIFGSTQQTATQVAQPEQQQQLSLASSQPKSPLSLIDRIQLSFADDNGRRNKLQEKFAVVRKLENGKYAVGDNPNQLTPIDPGGVFNDVLGDLADVVGEIPVIAGQILGTAMGAGTGLATGGTTSVPGAITGSMIGAGVGEGVKKGVGKMLGVNEQTATEMATDIAISSAFGAAGEGLAQGTRLGAQATKRVLAPKLAKLLDSSVNKLSRDPITGALIPKEPGLGIKSLAKMFKITAGVNENSTLDAAKHGFERTFSQENLSKRTIIPIVQKIQNSAKLGKKKLGDIVKKQQQLLIKKAKNIDVPVDDIMQRFKEDLIEAGITDNFGNFKTSKFRSKDKVVFKELLELFENPTTLVDQSGRPIASTTKSIKLPKAIKVEKMFEDSFEELSERGQKVMVKLLNGDKDLGTTGIRTRLNQIARLPNVQQESFVKANEQFSKFQNLTQRIRQVNSKDPAVLENFVKGLENFAEFTKDDFRILQEIVPEIKFLDKLEMFNAAQDFSNSNPNLLRLTAISGIIGASLPMGDPTPGQRVIRGGIGVVAGTPAGLRFLLTKGSKLASKTSKIVIQKSGKKSASKLTQGASGALLSNLISQKSKKK